MIELAKALQETLGKELGKTSSVLDRFKSDEPWGRNINPINGEQAQRISDAENSSTLHEDVKLKEPENNPDSIDTSENTDNKPDNQEARTIICRNQSLAGDVHPITGVPFVEKIVKDENGEDVRVVVPVFDSEFDAQLPDDMLQSSDKKQFAECNKQLKNKVDSAPEFAKKFTPEQLEQIKNGDTPDGYTWHHHEDTGKMQLVDTDTHRTGHTGGRAIWGGGTDNR